MQCRVSRLLVHLPIELTSGLRSSVALTALTVFLHRVVFVWLQARHTIRDVSLQLINRWRRGHTTDISAVAAGATAAAAAFAPHGPLPDHAAAAAGANTQEQPLVESIADVGQDSLSGKGPASCVKEPGASGAEDAKVMLRRAQGKGVNPGSFLGLMLNTKDSTTGQPFQDDVVRMTAVPSVFDVPACLYA
jgi:hypothetical protein